MSQSQVVLIEDNPADVFLVELALKENNVSCHLTTFENGQDALKALCPQGGEAADSFVPDLILLDLNTPKSDGFDVLVRLRSTAHLVNVQIAILTSSQAASDRNRSGLLGATRYIQKPSQLDSFLSTIGRAVSEMLADRNRLSELEVPRP